jgi:hypothetical protein
MKKLAVLAVAAMLVFSLAGQAAAYFEDFNLIRSIYTTTGTLEVGSDLGADVRTFAVAPGFVPPTNPVNQYAGDLISLSTFDGPLSSLMIGYWAHGMATQDFWATGFLTTDYGGTDTDGLVMGARKQSTTDGVMNTTQGYYAAFGAATGSLSKDELGSYFKKFDGYGSAVGSMGNNMASTASWEMTLSLADLSTNGYVDQLLYYFDYNGSTTN